MVIDTDGSAFITKAEFDSLKNNFQAQIDNYNNSIDSKIDGAIAAYLAGLTVAFEFELYVRETDSFYFKNSIKCQGDNGLLDLVNDRLSHTYGLTGRGITPGTYYIPKKRYLNLIFSSETGRTYKTALQDVQWSDSGTTMSYEPSYDLGTSAAILTVDPNKITKNWVMDNLLAPMMGKCEGYKGNGSYFASRTANNLPSVCIKKGTSVNMRRGSGRYTMTGQAEAVGVLGDINFEARNSYNQKQLVSFDSFGVGFGINKKNSISYINKYYKELSIMNTIKTQAYSYLDCSSQTSSSTAWDDTTATPITIEPTHEWSEQHDGTKQPMDSTSTTNSIYWSFQATKLQISDNSVWSDNYQLGIDTYVDKVKCFNEDCELENSATYTIPGDDLKFNRTGYYLDSSGNVVTKTDNVVKSGDVKYQKLIWKSEDLEPSEVAIESYSSLAGEPTYLGGGIPLAYTPVEKTGVKVKVNYEVKKLDGSAITAADGSLDIVIQLSNKQFKNGEVDTANSGTSKGSKTATVTNANATGTWTSDPFDMAQKSKIWLNAYVVQQGYNVIIKNINVQ